MDDNTLEAVKRLIELAEHFGDQGLTNGRDQVLETLDTLISKVDPNKLQQCTGDEPV